MNTPKELDPDHCPLCALRMTEVLEMVSRHRTTRGVVVYARCACGRLSVWLESATVEARPITHPRPAKKAPTRRARCAR
ncbi:MAG: hypothetical protein ACRDXX_08715 [Stackebrandtia sp.]